jgi:hypothetical protein
MNDEMKTLMQQYLDVRRNQRKDLMNELGLTEEEANQALSTLELYYDGLTQIWRRRFVPQLTRWRIRLQLPIGFGLRLDPCVVCRA